MIKIQTVFTLFAIFALAINTGAIASDPIQVKLQSSEVSVNDSIIKIGDIAEVTGGNSRQRHQVSELDIDKIGGSKQAISISAKQIEFRLLLAGISKSDFEITGQQLVRVQVLRSEDFQQKVEQIVLAEMVNQFGLTKSDVVVQLLDNNKLPRIQKRIDTSDFTAITVFSFKLPLGEQTVQINFTDAHGNRASELLQFRFVVFQDVAVARSRIPRGTIITADYIKTIRRPLADNSVEPADAIRLVGSITSKDIPRHEIVVTSHLVEESSADSVKLRRNALVDVVVIKGPYTITLRNAKVMTSGSIGDVVEVLNQDTNKRIMAVVRDKATVVVRN